MMASAAALLSSPNAAISGSMPLAMGSMSSVFPMTPVEATTMSLAGILSALPSRSHIWVAISTPFALQVLALPLLQIIACAYPSATFALVTAIGAPCTRFCV